MQTNNIHPTEEQLVLKMLSLETSAVFSGTALRNLTIDKRMNYITDRIIYRIHTMVPAENVKTETYVMSVSVPDGWWQMFKETYFTDWLKTRFPIVYKTKTETVTFDAYVMYPELPKVYECGNTKQVILYHVKVDQ